MEINLTNINQALMKCEKSLQSIIPEYYKAEMQFVSKKADLLLHAGAGDAGRREAEAVKAIELEPIYETYHALKLKVRLLYSEKDTLTTVSSNLRSANWQG